MGVNGVGFFGVRLVAPKCHGEVRDQLSSRWELPAAGLGASRTQCQSKEAPQ